MKYLISSVPKKPPVVYGQELAHAFEQVDVVSTISVASLTLTEALAAHLKEAGTSLGDTSDETIDISVTTENGGSIAFHISGWWILVFITSICLILATLMIGRETVAEYLQLLIQLLGKEAHL
ncbi:MAG: hypothetical protein SH847_05995 [Roseiflexaceae bacterium]|nr:hypothetical protein [Roseiflexaceae bacterium]